MRARPFIAAGESPRPYSEIRAERGDSGVMESTLRSIDELERLALDARDGGRTAEAERLQCEAEDLRCALAELEGRTVR
jgi:hypothetical protein